MLEEFLEVKIPEILALAALPQSVKRPMHRFPPRSWAKTSVILAVKRMGGRARAKRPFAFAAAAPMACDGMSLNVNFFIRSV